MTTAATVRRRLTREARAAEIRRQVRAEIAALEAWVLSGADLTEAKAVVVPRSLAPLVCSKAERQRARWRRLCFDRQCRCEVHAARHEIMAVRDLVPGELPFTPESWALHEADNALSLMLWRALVSAPEAAAEAAKHRPDDRETSSAWSSLRPVLDALGVLRPDREHGPPVVGELLTECCVGSPGPPAGAAPRRSIPRIAANCMGAPVIGP